jgi:hypothetical protein
MKSKLAKNFSYIGAGAGLVLFALFGLLYGSLVGGVIGLNISGAIFGSAVGPGIISRFILAVGMLSGVLVAAMVCVAGSAAAGYLLGLVLDPATWEKKETVSEHNKS